ALADYFVTLDYHSLVEWEFVLWPDRWDVSDLTEGSKGSSFTGKAAVDLPLAASMLLNQHNHPEKSRGNDSVSAAKLAYLQMVGRRYAVEVLAKFMIEDFSRGLEVFRRTSTLREDISHEDAVQLF